MHSPQDLPLAHPSSSKTMPEVLKCQDALELWCQRNNTDAVLVTAQDVFLSEYTPLAANLRYALSGFSGSTGDGVFITRKLAEKLSLKGRFQLFVDGRYHLQADQETAPEWVDVHKFGLATGLDDAMFTWLKNSLPEGAHLVSDLQRVGWSRWKNLQMLAAERNFRLSGLADSALAAVLPGMQGWKTERPIQALPDAVTGRSVHKNLSELRSAIQKQLGHNDYIHVTCMTDDAAWILNARGYHLPQLSSVLAYTFITETSCVVHLPGESEKCPLVGFSPDAPFKVTRGSLNNALETLRTESSFNNAAVVVSFSGRAMNAALPEALRSSLTSFALRDDIHALEELRANKTPQELNSIRKSFIRSSRAIARTLRFAKDCARNGQTLNEQQLADKIKSEYAAEGALELSFKTISGFAENGAVIHYSTPNQNKNAQPGDLLLLDSGAYYAEGFATDCTRVVAFANSPSVCSDWQKEIYTLTLKSCLAGLRSKFKLDTPCREIDAVARGPIQSKGYDYAHGTGHGIGIHVHESGIRLSPASNYTFTENAVVSVEPGVYLAGRGGVRIENVAIVQPEADSNSSQTHGLENVVFVGYDWDLIDVNLLSDEDKNDLAAYERKCQALGTQVTVCPLVS